MLVVLSVYQVSNLVWSSKFVSDETISNHKTYNKLYVIFLTVYLLCISHVICIFPILLYARGCIAYGHIPLQYFTYTLIHHIQLVLLLSITFVIMNHVFANSFLHQLCIAPLPALDSDFYPFKFYNAKFVLFFPNNFSCSLLKFLHFSDSV